MGRILATCGNHKLRIVENFENLLQKVNSSGYSTGSVLQQVSNLKDLFASNLRLIESSLIDFDQKNSSMFEAVRLVSAC
jgi:hypothetical protein